MEPPAPTIREEVRKQVRKIIAEQVGELEEGLCADGQNLSGAYNLDSLDVTEIILELSDQFDISIPDWDVERLTTIAAITDYVVQRLQTKSPLS